MASRLSERRSEDPFDGRCPGGRARFAQKAHAGIGMGDHRRMSDHHTKAPGSPTPRPQSLLARWRQLPAGERKLSAQLLLLLPVIDLSLRVVGFQRSWAWLARFTRRQLPVQAPDAASMAAAQRLAELGRAVGARSLWPASCLRQALAVWLLLRRRRLPAELRIGVQRGTTQFQAHAWVELDGTALDPSAASHEAFQDLPRASGYAPLDGKQRQRQ